MSLKFVPNIHNWQYASSVSNDDLASNERQAIISTNIGLVCDVYRSTSLGLDELHNPSS